MGFSKEEFIALLGRHTIEFAGEDKSGFKARWTQNPYVFDNTYFQELLLGERSKYFKLPQELALLDDASSKRTIEMYAQDEQRFFEDYARAHVRMSELGQEKTLLSEFEEANRKQGGYVEPISTTFTLSRP